MPGHVAERSVADAENACLNLAHLRRYTLGNRDLEIEILRLFAGQAPQVWADLAAAADEERWHMAAHTLKGSALAVGAARIAALALQAERQGIAGADRERLLARLDRAITDTAAAIGELQHEAA